MRRRSPPWPYGFYLPPRPLGRGAQFGTPRWMFCVYAGIGMALGLGGILMIRPFLVAIVILAEAMR